MGHANLSNLSRFFVRRLYAKGQLSIHDCVAAMVEAGVELHASEGGYDDEGMLSMGVMKIVHYLTRANPRDDHYSGPDGGGPWIEPALDVWVGKRKEVSSSLRRMLDDLQGMFLVPVGEDFWAKAIEYAAVVPDLLIDEGHPEWADWVRRLPRMRQVYSEWLLDRDDNWEWGEEDSEGDVFDRVPWRFCKGVRQTYPDGIPLLSNVTH